MRAVIKTIATLVLGLVSSTAFAVASKEESACEYATMILYDNGVEITSDNIKAAIQDHKKTNKQTIEPYGPNLFASTFSNKSIIIHFVSKRKESL